MKGVLIDKIDKNYPQGYILDNIICTGGYQFEGVGFIWDTEPVIGYPRIQGTGLHIPKGEPDRGRP